MEIFGLHYAIWIVLALYFAGMLLMGWWSKRGIKNHLGLVDVAFRNAFLLDNRADNSANAVPDDGGFFPRAFRQGGERAVYYRGGGGDDRFLSGGAVSDDSDGSGPDGQGGDGRQRDVVLRYPVCEYGCLYNL